MSHLCSLHWDGGEMHSQWEKGAAASPDAFSALGLSVDHDAFSDMYHRENLPVRQEWPIDLIN